MRISQSGIDLVKRFESLRLEAYQDVGGVWTCGYGSTGPDIGPGVIWTLDEATNRLESALERVCEAIMNVVSHPISQDQMDALCSFTYNVGIGAFEKSHLLSKVNSGDLEGAASEFLRWDRVKGRLITGLLKRREAERELFLA